MATSTQYVEKPALIYENIRKEQVEEIQPVIHREHQRTEVRQVTQPIVQGFVAPIQVEEKTLAPEIRTPTGSPAALPPVQTPTGTTTVRSATKVVEKPPIIMDTERTKFIEEIQPVIYRNVLQPSIVKETVDVYERVIDPNTFVRETRPPQYTSSVPQQYAPQPLYPQLQPQASQQYAQQPQQRQVLQQQQPQQAFQQVQQGYQVPQVQFQSWPMLQSQTAVGGQVLWPTQQVPCIPLYPTQTRTTYTTTTPVTYTTATPVTYTTTARPVTFTTAPVTYTYPTTTYYRRL